MTRYIFRRGLQSLGLLWVTTLLSFTLQQMAPGGPLAFFERNPRVSAAVVERLKRQYGLDRPLIFQYVAWLAGEDWASGFGDRTRWQSGRCITQPDQCSRGIIRLDFGRSFNFKGQSVRKVIQARIPATFQLGGLSFLLSILIGIPLGIIAALRRGAWPDHLIRIFTVVLNCVPEWWIGLLLLIILGGYLGLVPLGQMCTVGDCSFLDRLRHLILPTLVGATGGWIGFSRIIRYEMLDVMHQDYIRTAHAKGLPQSTVILRHVLRNTLIPVITGLGAIFLLLVSGSVLFELVFAWPGMGRLTYEAIVSRDYPLLMGLFVISSVLSIVGLLMVDILYGVVDPRVRYDRQI